MRNTRRFSPLPYFPILQNTRHNEITIKNVDAPFYYILLLIFYAIKRENVTTRIPDTELYKYKSSFIKISKI